MAFVVIYDFWIEEKSIATFERLSATLIRRGTKCNTCNPLFTSQPCLIFNTRYWIMHTGKGKALAALHCHSLFAKITLFLSRIHPVGTVTHTECTQVFCKLHASQTTYIQGVPRISMLRYHLTISEQFSTSIKMKFLLSLYIISLIISLKSKFVIKILFFSNLGCFFVLANREKWFICWWNAI